MSTRTLTKRVYDVTRNFASLTIPRGSPSVRRDSRLRRRPRLAAPRPRRRRLRQDVALRRLRRFRHRRHQQAQKRHRRQTGERTKGIAVSPVPRSLSVCVSLFLSRESRGKWLKERVRDRSRRRNYLPQFPSAFRCISFGARVDGT